METNHPQIWRAALEIVTDNNYCVKCHLIGDFSPAGSEGDGPAAGSGAQPPAARLSFSAGSADPVRILPYTGMPVNIPPDKPVDQKLFAGIEPGAVERRGRFADEFRSLWRKPDFDQSSRQAGRTGRGPAANAAPGDAGKTPAANPADDAKKPAEKIDTPLADKRQSRHSLISMRHWMHVRDVFSSPACRDWKYLRLQGIFHAMSEIDNRCRAQYSKLYWR